MKKIKLNTKYEWYSKHVPVAEILNYFKRNNRKVKKCLKIALKDISKTLNIHDWNIVITIRKNYSNKPMQYFCDIELKSKKNNINGNLRFADIKEILSNTGDLKCFQYTHKDNSFLNELVNDKHIIFLILDNFPKNNSNIIDFPIIENEDISYFKDKYEGFLKYIHNNNIYNFDLNDEYNGYGCCLQLFYICNKIYWRCSYSLPNKGIRFTHIRNIKQYDEKTIVRSMIEARIININQDIDEVLTWDIKDIFAMSKLIGY